MKTKAIIIFLLLSVISILIFVKCERETIIKYEKLNANMYLKFPKTHLKAGAEFEGKIIIKENSAIGEELKILDLNINQIDAVTYRVVDAIEVPYNVTLYIFINATLGTEEYEGEAIASFQPGTSNNLTITMHLVGDSNNIPIAAFTSDQTVVDEGQSIQFTDQSTNTPTSWSWDFGDGGISTEQNPTYAYNTAGTYTVSLEVTNDNGSDTLTKIDYITVNASGSSAPVAEFTANQTIINQGESISFTDQSTNTPTSWSWDFGDGGTSTEQNPTYIYNTSGTYTVSLTATNDNGSNTETKTDYITVNALGPLPTADFTANKTLILADETVIFTDQSTNTPTSWAWNFGDGNTSTIQNPSHTYNTAGKYAVELIATNENGSDTLTMSYYIIVGTGSVTDYDGNVYITMQINNQEWMAENLAVTHYPDGTPIILVEDSTNWANLAYTDPAYCYYNNLSSNGDVYGALYTWAAAMNGAASSDATPSGVQGVCPTGWHLPSDAEWTDLTVFLGGDIVAGGKMKEIGSTHWHGMISWASNSCGFTGLPGGCRFDNANFSDIEYKGDFMSSTEESFLYVWHHYLYYIDTYVHREADYKSCGFSVRCVKD
ncbi:MAG: hypothetical protein DRJ01_07890 [Bacteroidetes bacterium]|nr:MAG: hypothetical protein DRJ01_07890 [Bacteroidota bacterium]